MKTLSTDNVSQATQATSLVVKGFARVGMLWVALGMVLLTSCQKKCQIPPTTPFKSITETPWRLVETTNPQAQAATDRYSFITLEYTRDFQGDIKRIINNRQYDTPVFTFRFNIQTDPGGHSGLLRVLYSTPDPGQDAGGGGSSANGSTPNIGIQTSAPIDYSYRLGNDLVLTEQKTGYEWHYVPFIGVVDPDSTCTF